MSRRVVIAEDEAIIRLDLKEILQDEGYEVVGETGRGDEAVELVRAHHPDLAILDVKMPGADGLAAARAIRDLGERVAVLILTAFSQRNLIDEARDAGVAAYLVKPFQRTELVPAIDQAMARVEQEWAIDEEAASAGAADPAGGSGTTLAEDKLETRRMVDSAKGVLMERHGLTEAAAFGFIQKTAMGTRSRMIDVSRQVLDGSLAP
jgi:response regulator NasT